MESFIHSNNIQEIILSLLARGWVLVIQLISFFLLERKSVLGGRTGSRKLESMAGIGGRVRGWVGNSMCRARWERTVTVTVVNNELRAQLTCCCCANKAHEQMLVE